MCSGSEDLLARTVIVGIIMAFRKLTLVALKNVLSYRVPFVLSSIIDFKQNLPDKTSSVSPLLYIYIHCTFLACTVQYMPSKMHLLTNSSQHSFPPKSL